MQPFKQDNRIGFCGALLSLAFLLRVVAGTGPNAATAGLFSLPQEATVPTATIATQPEDPEDPALIPPQETAEEGTDAVLTDPAIDETVSTTIAPFTTAEADAISITGGCSYSVDKQSLLLEPLSLAPASDGPQVLIIHTHTSESYRPEPGWEYTESDTLRTEDPNYNVVRVGRELADALEALGVETLHDETVHDVPSYNDSYARTLEDIQADLEANPSIQLVLDIHRDAIADEYGNFVSTSVLVDGVSTARVMLVVGTDEGGLTHPNWEQNLSCALKLQTLIERNTPGLCRSLNLRTERFNQHTSPGALLLEIGSSGDTLAEALEAANQIAPAIAQLLELANAPEDT
jgi:stage II sporulation protein P